MIKQAKSLAKTSFLAPSFKARAFVSALPFSLCCFCLLLDFLPSSLLLGTLPPLNITLIAVYFWSMTRPEHMPLTSIFLLGCVHDLISGAPFGMSAFIYLAASALAEEMKPGLTTRAFPIIWISFALVALMAGMTLWILSSLYLGFLFSPLPALMQAAFLTALYPLMSALFLKMERQTQKMVL